MNIVLAYIFPIAGQHDGQAQRFADTFRASHPEQEHALFVICNGGRPSQQQKDLFHDIPACFMEGDNVGWDIGAYQALAGVVDCDMLVGFGSSTYFKRAGWLKRMAEIFQSYGQGNLYGATASLAPAMHIRTTAFWFEPELLRGYPYAIETYQDRYEFEHGSQNFTLWAMSQGRQPYVVYWDALIPIQVSDGHPNGYHNGDQSRLLAYDRCTELHCP